VFDWAEVSVLALTDGLTIRPLLPAQDHKRIGEGDRIPVVWELMPQLLW